MTIKKYTGSPVRMIPKASREGTGFCCIGRNVKNRLARMENIEIGTMNHACGCRDQEMQCVDGIKEMGDFRGVIFSYVSQQFVVNRSTRGKIY